MKCDIIAYLDSLIDGSIRIDDTVIADMYVVAYYSMRVNLTTVTDYTSLANAGEWSDITVLTNLCCFCDVCLRGYTCLLWFAGFIYLKKLGYTLIRILTRMRVALTGFSSSTSSFIITIDDSVSYI